MPLLLWTIKELRMCGNCFAGDWRSCSRVSCSVSSERESSTFGSKHLVWGNRDYLHGVSALSQLPSSAFCDRTDRSTLHGCVAHNSSCTEQGRISWPVVAARESCQSVLMWGESLVRVKWSGFVIEPLGVEEQKVCNRQDVETLKVFGMIDCVTFSEREFPQASPNCFN